MASWSGASLPPGPPPPPGGPRGGGGAAAAAGGGAPAGAAISPPSREGDDPLAYQDQLDFNTRHFPQYSHVIEYAPSSGSPERSVYLCRCWQSKKFPYCDDTHKALMEAGDNVGPFVGKLRSGVNGDATARSGNSLQQSMTSDSQHRQRNASDDLCTRIRAATAAPSIFFPSVPNLPFGKPSPLVSSFAIGSPSPHPQEATGTSQHQPLLLRLLRGRRGGGVTAGTAAGSHLRRAASNPGTMATAIAPQQALTTLHGEVFSSSPEAPLFFARHSLVARFLSPHRRRTMIHGASAALLLAGCVATVGALCFYKVSQQRRQQQREGAARWGGRGEEAQGDGAANVPQEVGKGLLRAAAAAGGAASAATPTTDGAVCKTVV